MKIFLRILLLLFLLFIAMVYISVSGTEKEFGKATVVNTAPKEAIDFSDLDSVTVKANTLYDANAVKWLMQGENYRQTWQTPIRVPVVWLDSLKGGMRVLEEGGGSQTHSLDLQSATGEIYTLRSITKDPQDHVPDIARTLGLENIIIDGISAQHPYGAVLAGRLSEAAGIPHTHPQIVYVPRQAILRKYNEKYGNRLFLLEYETEGKKNWTEYRNVTELIETENLIELKADIGSKVKIDERELVRARLFDLLIGDWDRHAKQWGWILEKKPDGSLLAHPLPGDRDNAFFKIGGVIPGILTNKNIQPMVRPFRNDIDYMPGLVYPFDQYFLQKTPKKIFLEEAKALQEIYTEDVVRRALQAWPEEIAALDGPGIVEKFLSRKEKLVEYAESFYEVIQDKGFPQRPLKGSEDLKIDGGLEKCFECGK